MLSLPDEVLQKIMNTEAKTVRVGEIVWPMRTGPETRSRKRVRPGYAIRNSATNGRFIRDHNKGIMIRPHPAQESKRMDDLFRRILYTDNNVKNLISELEKRPNFSLTHKTSMPKRTNIYAYRKDNTRTSESSALMNISKALQNVARPTINSKAAAVRRRRREEAEEAERIRSINVMDLFRNDLKRIASRRTFNQHRMVSEAAARKLAQKVKENNERHYSLHPLSKPGSRMEFVMRELKRRRFNKAIKPTF